MAPQGPLLRRRRAAAPFRTSRINYVRTGIIILSLASFLLTMLYMDFTDSDMDQGVDELSEMRGQQQADGDVEEAPEAELQDELEEGEEDAPGIDSAEGGHAPEVLNIQPFHGPARGGLELTIHGHHFMGFGDWTTTAAVNGKQCTSTEVLNFDTVICTLPGGVGAGLNVGVQKTVGGKALSSSPNTLFSYDAPLVEHVAPDHSATEGGALVTVYGTNFGFAGDDDEIAAMPRVLVGDAACSDVKLKSDNELTCTVPPGDGGGTTVQVTVGSGQHVVESHRSRNLFTYILSPKEKMSKESTTLLDGLHVKHSSIPVFMNKGALTGLNEFSHKDLFTGRTIAFSATPELISFLPEHDLRDHHESCAVVLNSAHLLDTSFGADIDKSDAVFRFNDSPMEEFRSEVGGKTSYRFVQLPLLRTLLSKSVSAGESKWHPQPGEKLIMMSEYAQDLFIQLHRAFPRTDLLFPSSALMANILTLYTELRRRFIDLGIDQELAKQAGTSSGTNIDEDESADENNGGQKEDDVAEERRRSLLGGATVSMERLARFAQQHNELSEVEPATGQTRPSQVLSAIVTAIQMCKEVKVFGYDSIFTGAANGANRLSYYSKSPVSFSVHDISSTVNSAAQAESIVLENALVELFQLVGHLKVYH